MTLYIAFYIVIAVLFYIAITLKAIDATDRQIAQSLGLMQESPVERPTEPKQPIIPPKPQPARQPQSGATEPYIDVVEAEAAFNSLRE